MMMFCMYSLVYKVSEKTTNHFSPDIVYFYNQELLYLGKWSYL